MFGLNVMNKLFNVKSMILFRKIYENFIAKSTGDL